MVRSPTYQPHTRSNLDPIRIVAIAAAIAFNAAMLALLLRPPEYTVPVTQADPPPVIFITPDPKPVLPPVDVTKNRPQPPHPMQQRVEPTHVPIAPVTFQDSTPISIAVDTNPPTDTIGLIKPSTSPQTVEASLTAIASPAPTYPHDALRDSITGTVELELLVGVDGNVLSVRITHSSGDHQLDNAARDQVLRNWRFQPAMRDGIAVQALGRVPIVFTLDGR